MAGGMVGELRAPGGEVCPMLVPAPFSLGEDITTNTVCCATYCNPPHQRHTCRPLPDQSLEVHPFPPRLSLHACSNMGRSMDLCCRVQLHLERHLAASAWKCQAPSNRKIYLLFTIGQAFHSIERTECCITKGISRTILSWYAPMLRLLEGEGVRIVSSHKCA